MTARHLDLMRFDFPKAVLCLALAALNVAEAVVAAGKTVGASGADLASAVVFLAVGILCAGLFGAWGIAYAVRSSFGLDVPEEEGPRE